MEYDRIASGISFELQVTSPAVALSFVGGSPAGMTSFDEDVPSACALRRKAEASIFYTPAEKHFNCPIGAMTMGFEMPKEVQQQLMGVVEKMYGAGYISREETAKIPGVKRKKSGIVYGPLASFPLEPDLVLMWLTPRQAMIYSEAAGTCRWTEAMPATAFGRPSSTEI